MKQTIFMALVTAVGVFGALFVEPFVGVAVYYFFAVLRPQYLWEWALPTMPENTGWSEIVAWATIFATIWLALTHPSTSNGIQKPRFSAAHKAVLVFGAWICLTYITSQNQDVAWIWFLEYMKLFLMFAIAAVAIRSISQLWWIYLASTVALVYIAYELNFLYFTEGRLDIYRHGYGGLDNNGAGLMLAMAIPLCLHVWEGQTRIWRWVFIAAIPVLLHAVLMSYSRGAMLSLAVSVPLLVLRSRRKWQFALVLPLLIATVPYLAGKEIRERFFTIQDYANDETANARFDSWNAAFRIANDYPVFGVGIRNSNLFSFKYGADMEGRTIHSQYLQTLADAGYPGLFLYLTALGCTWIAMARARRALKKRDGPDAKLAHSMLNGVEGALFIFCFGALFLSLEVFELPYLMMLIGAQIAALSRLPVAATSVVPAAAPLPVVALRA